jgi:hypothetical protein
MHHQEGGVIQAAQGRSVGGVRVHDHPAHEQLGLFLDNITD